MHKPITKKKKKMKKRKVCPSFKDNIWGADLVDMELISKYNKGILFLLCVIDIFSKYAWVVSLKYEKGIIITNVFQKTLNESKRNPDKTWLDKGGKFCNISMKSWLKWNVFNT